MFQVISIPLFCLVMLGSYCDTQAMKRVYSPEVTNAAESVPGPILSLPSELHGAIVAYSQDKNALRLTCKAFSEWASFAQWRVLLKMFHTLLHLSAEDQERIGAVLLDENNVPLMKKLLDRYPEYAKRIPQFAFDKPLSYATSPEMKQLLEPTSVPVKSATPQDINALCQAAMTLTPTTMFDRFLAPTIPGMSPEQMNIMRGLFGALEKGQEHMLSFAQSQPFVTLCEETSPVLTLAYSINTVFLLDNFGLDRKQMGSFYHAILKGDIAYIKKALLGGELNILRNHKVTGINYALQLAALFGHYDIVELLLEQPVLKTSEYSIWGQVLEAALGILHLNLGNGNSHVVTKKIMRPHAKIAQLIIIDGRVKYLPQYLDRVIQAGNPAIVKALLEKTKALPTEKDLALAIETGNEEIINMVEEAMATKNSVQ